MQAELPGLQMQHVDVTFMCLACLVSWEQGSGADKSAVQPLVDDLLSLKVLIAHCLL